MFLIPGLDMVIVCFLFSAVCCMIFDVLIIERKLFSAFSLDDLATESEDKYWGMKAEEAAECGFLGAEESERRLMEYAKKSSISTYERKMKNPNFRKAYEKSYKKLLKSEGIESVKMYIAVSTSAKNDKCRYVTNAYYDKSTLEYFYGDKLQIIEIEVNK